ncbi:BadF/BadG/BcrA/BcrD ATPase family protein [Devosia sp. RR2S18]|uniref:BadF/BadG/BcrA/BcrD ATPase family protein n=1 Tax=Devosia rhizosphaerae TaxID=3049774 RepID=UPI0025408022|nr:BadF/BadG/BcrA/BcrD ATPase family protein [Devosia sp. RR2S18]WIJ23952.1 BadF/BadG/BcrA/BcrD ATPase family protein [Devosia sp. RR2S18]
MTTAVHLGIDVGGTASRWVACDHAGHEIGRGAAAGATAHVFNPTERDRLTSSLRMIAEGIQTSNFLALDVTIGLTGFGAAVRSDVQAITAGYLNLPAHLVTAVDDMVLAYAAAFAPGEGILVSAGTGSIGLYIGPDVVVRVGGRGILIDDAGSGSWIALQALDRLYKTLDHTGSFDAVEPLAREIFREIGGSEWSDVRQFVYGSDRGRIGALAVAVARAATAGDATAAAVLEEAGAELARLAVALTSRVGRRPTGFVGGVVGLHERVQPAIRRALPGHEVRFLSLDAALTAARLQTPQGETWRRIVAAGAGLG